MKTLFLIFAVGVLFIALVGGSCHKPPVTQPEVSKPVVQDTTTKPPEKPVEPPTKPSLKEDQFQTVYFDFDKYTLRPDAKAALDNNYKLLTEYGDAIVKIEGHCDERGTVEYNLSLGEKRARAAMEYLVGLGISANRISIISYGKERPAVMGSDEAAWSKNRRGEFRIVSQ
jgi:peptidoglycan-associated lipoprotein